MKYLISTALGLALLTTAASAQLIIKLPHKCGSAKEAVKNITTTMGMTLLARGASGSVLMELFVNPKNGNFIVLHRGPRDDTSCVMSRGSGFNIAPQNQAPKPGTDS